MIGGMQQKQIYQDILNRGEHMPTIDEETMRIYEEMKAAARMAISYRMLIILLARWRAAEYQMK